MTTRRSFLTGLASLVAAPALITTPGLLMPVKALPKVWVPCVVDIEIKPGLLATYAAETLSDALWYLRVEATKRDSLLLAYGAQAQCLPAGVRLTGSPSWCFTGIRRATS